MKNYDLAVLPENEEQNHDIEDYSYNYVYQCQWHLPDWVHESDNRLNQINKEIENAYEAGFRQAEKLKELGLL